MKNFQSKSQIIIYKAETGETKIDVRFDEETVWLTQNDLAKLFQTTKQNIGQHIKNIFDEDELKQNSVVKEFFTTATDGKNYTTYYYNLDMIISVGYRVKSSIATTFRQWATAQLKEYIIKGFVMDDERLKNPDLPFDYFEELTRRISEIRTSEKRFYRKITDIYATSVDYDPKDQRSILFFKTVQNKEEAIIAKNYLNERELLVLNNLVEQYLVFAEGQALQRVPMYMQDWIDKLHSFLKINNKNILEDAGKISHELATEIAEKNFDEYQKNETKILDNDFDLVALHTLEIAKKKKK